MRNVIMQCVRAAFASSHRDSCPCCGQGMQKSKNNKQHANTKTKGHIYHSNDRRWKEDYWFFMCYKCNQDQGALSIWEWASVLKLKKDPRWRRVVRIICEIKIGFVETAIKDHRRNNDDEFQSTRSTVIQG